VSATRWLYQQQIQYGTQFCQQLYKKLSCEIMWSEFTLAVNMQKKGDKKSVKMSDGTKKNIYLCFVRIRVRNKYK
jgi:hypothetical protein